MLFISGQIVETPGGVTEEEWEILMDSLGWLQLNSRMLYL